LGCPSSRGVWKVCHFFWRNGVAAANFLWMPIDLSHMGYETSLLPVLLFYDENREIRKSTGNLEIGLLFDPIAIDQIVTLCVAHALHQPHTDTHAPQTMTSYSFAVLKAADCMRTPKNHAENQSSQHQNASTRTLAAHDERERATPVSDTVRQALQLALAQRTQTYKQ